MGGFLNRAVDREAERREEKVKSQLERERLREEAKRKAEEEEAKRKEEEEQLRKEEEERREKEAEKEQKAQMQRAFKKIDEGRMLYEDREIAMAPIREKEHEKKLTLELEKDLLNVIDDSEGRPTSKNLDEFMVKKEKQNIEQNDELDQKKKVLDKIKKEEQWDEDDTWSYLQKVRKERREKYMADFWENGAVPGAPPKNWEHVEVKRWAEQRFRELMVGVAIEDAEELDPKVAAGVLGIKESDAANQPGGNFRLKAIITDVLKLEGDCFVVTMRAGKPPMHFWEYTPAKLEWEVTLAQPGETSYRTGHDLIKVAAFSDSNKAPPSIAPNRVLAGTFKIREFCSMDNNGDGSHWRFEVKVKKPCEYGRRLEKMAEPVRDRLKAAVERRLVKWIAEYTGSWTGSQPPGNASAGYA